MEVSIYKIHIVKTIRYIHTGENALRRYNLAAIILANTVLCKNITYIMIMFLYSLILTSFIINLHTLLLHISSNLYHYVYIISVPNLRIFKRHNNNIQSYAKSATFYIFYYILHILKNVKQHSCAHKTIKIYVKSHYRPYQTKYRDGL